jgi:uncharacterized Zn-binding protein involved in type VI secretion
MAALSRQGDVNTTGGKIIRGAGTVFANGIAVGLHVSGITPHSPWPKPKNNPHPPHAAATTTEGSPTVFAESCPVLRVGSGNTCGHKIVQGSDNVFCP